MQFDLPDKPADHAALLIYTLGGFRVERDGIEIKATAWGREKAI